MNVHPNRRISFQVVVGLIAVATVPVIANHFRTAGQAESSDLRCAVDGQSIDSAYRVSIATTEKTLHFCCLRCARDWYEQYDGDLIREATVVAEDTDRPLPASAAFFVRSRVVTNERTGNRVHVFSSAEAVDIHVRAFGGQILQYESLESLGRWDDEARFMSLDKQP